MTDTGTLKLLNNLIQLQLYYCNAEDIHCHVDYDTQKGFLIMGDTDHSAQLLQVVFETYPIQIGDSYDQANAWIGQHFARKISAYREEVASQN